MFPDFTDDQSFRQFQEEAERIKLLLGIGRSVPAVSDVVAATDEWPDVVLEDVLDAEIIGWA